jgi:hypothetical protein
MPSARAAGLGVAATVELLSMGVGGSTGPPHAVASNNVARQAKQAARGPNAGAHLHMAGNTL